jgi:hypothetical protein
MTAEVSPWKPPGFRVDALWSSLSRLDVLLQGATTAVDAAYGSGAASEPYRGLYITSGDAQRLLKREAGAPLLAAAEHPGEQPMPEESRFPSLERLFGLTKFDVDVVMLTLAPEVDLRYERIFAYLQDDVTRRRPSVELALNLLCASREAKIAARGRFEPGAPLIQQRLVHLTADPAAAPAPLLAQFLKLDDAIVRFLLGHGGLDARLQPFAELMVSPQPGPEHDLTAPLVATVTGCARGAHRPHFFFEGVGSVTKRMAGEYVAAALGLPLLRVKLGKMPGPQAEFETSLAIVFREARLLNAAVYLEEFDSLRTPDRTYQLAALRGGLDDAALVVMLDGQQAWDPQLSTVTKVAFEEPDYKARYHLWWEALGRGKVAASAPLISELACRYRLTGAEIQRSVETAARQAALKPGPVELEDLASAARAQAHRDIGSLARRIRPVYRWQDIVLPPNQMAQLEEICRQARYRHVVFDDWGFDHKLSLGKGLAALFSGPPGTGKTMAAEVIANDLGLELYKIDLSQVVSKYIGETEKNMDRLFAEARAGNVILFFDEADALFGKRTAVQDAHDRYANIEISYLLQKMEEHQGVSILATNLRQNLDIAFTRRLNFIVEFPFPDEASRLCIWQKIWPPEAPRSKELDLGFMASQFKIAGGSVKNVAIAAAFMAAVEDDKEITTLHLLRAVRRELEKAGRTVTSSEFGRYSHLVEGRRTNGSAP